MTLPARAACLDAQGAQSPEHQDRGIARYVVEHTRALHRVRPEALHSVLLNPNLALTGNVDWLLGKGLLGWTSGDRRVPRRRRPAPLLYHVMSPFELQRTLDELWPHWARQRGIRTVVTLYDLIPLVFAEHYMRDPVIRTRYEARTQLVRRADHVLAISRTTADDAIERIGIEPERLTVIDAGATEKFSRMHRTREGAVAALAKRLPQIREGHLLYVAGFEFRKNLERLIAGYALLPEGLRARHQLVIACRMRPEEAELVQSWADGASIRPGELVITGYVSDADLGALYHACTLFLFASIYEGSGLPILEAMSCGAPVVASRTSTSAEILGDLEGTFDPFDPRAIGAVIEQTLSTPAALTALTERSRRRVAAFTWDRVAARSLDAYERVLGAGATSRQRRRPRLALVTPWPPHRSGIADYSFRLARELGEKADIDVVVEGPIDQFATPRERGVRLITASAFRSGESLRQPDRILYCMGNSSYHGHVYELLRERPGAVVAHDVRLTGFYGWFAGVERPEDPAGRLGERIEALYGPRLPPSLTAESIPGWERQAALGIYMTREIQQYAEEIFVHSRYAAEILELDRGVLDRPVPVSVLPFAVPSEHEQRLRSDGDGDSAPLIVSVGVLSEVKGLAELIAAVALVAEQRPALRLVIAGPAEQEELERWSDAARTTAPGVSIDVPGHLSAERYERLLADADLAVQLRTLSNGEASAAVADCLSAGIPTLATDIGWVSELPADAIARVPAGAPVTLLADRIERLLDDAGVRAGLSAGAMRHARSSSFAEVADAYLAALELGG